VAGDKRELILDLLARDKSGPGTASFGKNIKDVGDAADKADNKLGKFTETTVIAGKGADDLGDESEKAARRLGKLDREIGLTVAELKVLARSFADTDDAAERLDISKGIRKAENDLRRLNKSKSILSTILPDPKPEEAQGWAKKLMGSLGGALATAGSGVGELAGNHVGLTIGAAAGAAAAPVLASTLASVLSSGIGLVGIGAGVLLAVKSDKGIQDAGKAAGTKFVDALSASARSAFGGPILDSIHVLESAGEHVADSWGKAFDALGPSVLPLAKDLIDAGVRISDSLSGIAAKSGPALDGLGDSIGLVADGVGDFLDTVADGGPEAAANLELVAGATADVLRETGNFLNALNQVSGNAWLTGPLIPLLRKHYDEAADATGTFAKHTAGAADAMDDAAGAAQAQTSALQGLNKELTAGSDPVFALMDAEDGLAAAQKDAADAAKRHGKGSRESDAALRKLAEAAINVEGKAEALAGTFDGQMTPSMRATLSAAGLTKSEINRLGDQFVAARKDGNSFAKTYRANMKVDGTETAAARVAHVRDLLAQVRSKRISVSVLVADSQLNKVNNTLNRFGGARAGGGPTAKDVPYWVGENGPELFVPQGNGRILSSPQSKNATRGHASSGLSTGGGGGQVIRLELVGQAEFVSAFRYLVRTANLLQDA
jgi:hypothetical protein